jgi:tRNA(Ile)-lysidine synthase
MSGPDPAVAAVRVAVRRCLAAPIDRPSGDRAAGHGPSGGRATGADPSGDRAAGNGASGEQATGGDPSGGRATGGDPFGERARRRDPSGHIAPGAGADSGPRRVLVACSGGADSVALAAAVAFEAPRLGVAAGLVTVDHGLRPGSAERAEAVADLGRRLGLDPVLVRTVRVGTEGGPEAAARAARYAALAEAAERVGADAVLLGHTLDDQAETVLLGLGRGSGPRSVAGMRPADPPWLRPLLGVRRATARAACAAQGLPTWDDPDNADPRFTRSRLRHEVLPLLEDVLRGGVAEALARTAELVRQDLDALDARAANVTAALAAGDSLDAGLLSAHPPAVRARVVRSWLHRSGVGALTSAHLDAVDALVVDWHGQGAVGVPGGLAVSRRHGRLHLDRPDQPNA